MQTIGITPDCVHCRFMVRQQNGEYRCRQHDMILHSPVRLFCKNLTPPMDSDDYKQWFEASLELDQLEASVLYTWVDTTVKDTQGTKETLTDRATITSFDATKVAAKKALTEAEITRDDIAHLEIHDCFSIAALINLEDLGYAEPGRGIRWYQTESEKMSVNASGGLKACGHPVAATGIKQLIDAGKQLEQSGASYALTQNFGGACASCAIHILEQA